MSFINKTLLSFVLFVMFFSFSSVVRADQWYSTGRLSIIQLLVHNDSLEVMLEGNVSCNRVFRLHINQENYEVKASALIAAFYAGHRVTVYYGGSLDSCSTSLKRFKVYPRDN